MAQFENILHQSRLNRRAKTSSSLPPEISSELDRITAVFFLPLRTLVRSYTESPKIPPHTPY